MAKHFKEGKMRNVLINKEKYRAVALERKLIIFIIKQLSFSSLL